VDQEGAGEVQVTTLYDTIDEFCAAWTEDERRAFSHAIGRYCVGLGVSDNNDALDLIRVIRPADHCSGARVFCTWLAREAGAASRALLPVVDTNEGIRE
jgi:hypothetical protein